jgi:hypothetical protein
VRQWLTQHLISGLGQNLEHLLQVLGYVNQVSSCMQRHLKQGKPCAGRLSESTAAAAILP